MVLAKKRAVFIVVGQLRFNFWVGRLAGIGLEFANGAGLFESTRTGAFPFASAATNLPCVFMASQRPASLSRRFIAP